MSTENLSYTDAMNELESIVARVESNQMSIDDLAESLKRAQELVRFCRDRLLKTEKEVNNILESEDMKATPDDKPSAAEQPLVAGDSDDLPF